QHVFDATPDVNPDLAHCHLGVESDNDIMTKLMKKGVTLEVLELFREVAIRENITAAGKEVGITASLASRRIAALELALDVRLFQRTTRRIRLTEAGERALEWA